MEIKEIMTVVKLVKVRTLSPELEGICREIAALSAAWARNVRFALLGFEEAYQRESWLESWAVLAQEKRIRGKVGFEAARLSEEPANFLRRQHIYKENQESKVQFRHFAVVSQFCRTAPFFVSPSPQVLLTSQ
jgi:hypothetical protein